LFSEAGQYWKAGDYEQSAATWKSLEGMIADTFNDKEYIAQIASDQASRTMISQAAQAAQEATKYLGAAAQGAVAAAGVKGSLAKKESIEHRARPLSEGQVYLVFKRITESQLNEGPMDAIKGLAGKVMNKARTVGTNLTTEITADKLNSAWQKAGAPTDSEELKKFLTGQGVDTTTIDTVYKSMKIASGNAQAATSLYAQVKTDLAKLDKKGKQRLSAYLQKQLGTA
jgi:ribosomal protein L12E/L44/L45/RPP1/RPP2